MTTVLALGLPELPDPLGKSVLLAAALPTSLDAPSVGPLLDVLADSGEDEPLLVVHRAAQQEQAARVVHLIRSSLELQAVARISSQLSPLGCATVARICAELTGTFQLAGGSVVAAAGWLERQLLVAAWLPTVAKLDQVELSLGHHLQSFVPGSQFVVCLSPERRVDRLGAQALELPRPELLGERPHILLSGDGSLAWMDATVLPAFPGATVVRQPGDAASAQFWGTPKAVEVVGRPDDLEPVAEAVRTRWPASPCRWCGLPSPTGTCGWCAMTPAAAEFG